MAASPAGEGAGLESAAEAAARTLGIDGLRVFMLGSVAHIEGTAPSVRHKRAAAELIGPLTGASHVVNRLRVAPREVRSDSAIGQRLRTAFEEAPEVDAATVQPEVNHGVVELRGIVSSLYALCAAERAAWSVGGVAGVANRLRVAGTDVSPDDLARQLEADLCACLGLPPTTVRLDMRGDTVYLEGIVPSPHHRLAAEDLVRAHELVQDVVNSLAVAGIVEPAPERLAEKRMRAQAS
jgi:osmotically-inducible protein OsmY